MRTSLLALTLLAASSATLFVTSCGTKQTESDTKSYETRYSDGLRRVTITYSDFLDAGMGIDRHRLGEIPFTDKFGKKMKRIFDGILTKDHSETAVVEEELTGFEQYLSRFGQCLLTYDTYEYRPLHIPGNLIYALDNAKPLTKEGEKNYYIPLHRMHKKMTEGSVLQNLYEKPSSVTASLLGAAVGVTSTPVLYNLMTRGVQDGLGEGAGSALKNMPSNHRLVEAKKSLLGMAKSIIVDNEKFVDGTNLVTGKFFGIHAADPVTKFFDAATKPVASNFRRVCSSSPYAATGCIIGAVVLAQGVALSGLAVGSKVTNAIEAEANMKEASEVFAETATTVRETVIATNYINTKSSEKLHKLMGEELTAMNNGEIEATRECPTPAELKKLYIDRRGQIDARIYD